MPNRVSHYETLHLTTEVGLMMIEPQSVIAMRLWGLAGLWNVTPAENQRMIFEKSNAGVASVAAIQTAIMQGPSPAAVAIAGIKPLRKKTNSNHRRLSKRGPA